MLILMFFLHDVKEYLAETLKSLDMVPIAMEVMPDHIHLLVDCKPPAPLV